MKTIIVFASLVVAIYGNLLSSVLPLGLYYIYGRTTPIYNAEAIITAVNSANTTWKAGHNFARDVPVKYIKGLLGVKKSETKSHLPLRTHEKISNGDIPAEFDSRKQWPYCPIGHIVDQGTCGSCWAVAAASAFSDRTCIASKGKFTLPLSAEELLSCCGESCGSGCEGGDPEAAWNFFQNNGISTGGDFNSSIGCQPYQIQPCEHHTTGKRPQCSDLPSSSTPECKQSCINTAYQTKFSSDHHKLKTAYSVSSVVEDIQQEIMTGGPVEVAFTVFADFPTYKEGVYQHTTGDLLGAHAVRLIGWGIEKGVPYWLIANSWNTDWGFHGYFKILRGQNECGIESEVHSGEPIV